MHVAKVVLLVLLTLAVMRVASWSLGWLLNRFAGTKRLWTALLSNGVALMAFAGVLVAQRMPGEMIDVSALTFGVIVFAAYALIDIRWARWGKNGTSVVSSPSR
jgi:hypothetical protein